MAIQVHCLDNRHATAQPSLLSQGSHVAPSPQRCVLCKQHKKELTYCPVYGFKSRVICAKGLTPAIFCTDPRDYSLGGVVGLASLPKLPSASAAR